MVVSAFSCSLWVCFGCWLALACLKAEGLDRFLLCAGNPQSELFSLGADGADKGVDRSLISFTKPNEGGPDGFAGIGKSVSSSDDKSIWKR